MLDRYRGFQAVRALLDQTDHPFKGPVIRDIERELAALRPEAGNAQLQRMISRARAPALLNRYREAYDRLETLSADAPELVAFDLDAGEVQAQVRQARAGVLADWNAWAETHRQTEEDQKRFREAHPDLLPPGVETSPSVAVESDAVETLPSSAVKSDDMVFIPAGRFRMGSNDGDKDEKPVHTVEVDGFWMDKYEVTTSQYAEFVRATEHEPPDRADWGMADWNTWDRNRPPPGYEDHPVVGVSWDEAAAYCKWTGKRLPTEAEWEKACRGESKETRYPWGDKIDPDRANYKKSGKGKTAPVGSYEPNGYGLYGMSGNVWEWVADWYDSGYYRRSPSNNPVNEQSESIYRVLRGGSWHSKPNDLRCASRWSDPGFRFIYLGFRCAR